MGREEGRVMRVGLALPVPASSLGITQVPCPMATWPTPLFSAAADGV